ncbi:MAG: hypothetical protein II988_02020 [Clostridia bacterium]|nr:hypothetical protein [Clostridia bacterium]
MKRLYTLLVSLLLCMLCAFTLTACGGGDDDSGKGGAHEHDYQATEYFDKDNTFAKVLECKNAGCSQKTITYDSIEITNADQLVALNQYFAGSYKFNGASLKVTIKNDIDMTGKSWTPIKISANNRFAYTFEGAASGVTITNLNVTGDYAGFFGEVSKELTVKNITVKNSVFTSEEFEDCYAGGLIAFVNGAKVTVNNCSVVDCQINGYSAAGAIYGKAYKETADSQPIIIEISNVTVDGNTITSDGFAGGFYGIGADAPVNALVVNMGKFVLTDNTITSNALDQLSAGVFVGKIGYSRLFFETAGNATVSQIASSNQATSNGTEISANSRLYGRTGWHAGYLKSEVGGLSFGGEITNNETVN